MQQQLQDYQRVDFFKDYMEEEVGAPEPEGQKDSKNPEVPQIEKKKLHPLITRLLIPVLVIFVVIFCLLVGVNPVFTQKKEGGVNFVTAFWVAVSCSVLGVILLAIPFFQVVRQEEVL